MKVSTSVVLFAAVFWLTSCSRTGDTMPNPPALPPVDTTNVSVWVDCGAQEGEVLHLEQANDVSTSSPLPGEAAKEWLQSLHHKIVRVWIQLRYVYNKGNIDYNYSYGGSNVPVEDALSFYSGTTDSLLIVLSAYNATATWPLPARGKDFQQFVTETLIHYKTKFPKIKYIQVGNEPDYNGESVAEYYPVYQDYYHGINDANTALGLTGGDRMLVSNGAFTSTSSFKNILNYSADFLSAYAADTDPGKRLDFFSFHCYTESDRPMMLAEDRTGIDSIMTEKGLPVVPVFVTELGLVGGSFIPSVWEEKDAVIAEAAGQLTKALYLYRGGISTVFNWGIYHGTIRQKSELADLVTGDRYPYGNALTFCREVSDRGTALQAYSKLLGPDGLGVHVLASMGAGKGIAVLIWNYNWTKHIADKDVNVLVRNIPEDDFAGGKINRKVYLIDSQHNNYFNNQTQNRLKASTEETINYNAAVKTQVKMEGSSVALILLTAP